MDHGGEGVSVYAEAKSEYTKQLCQYLVPALHKYFLDMLDDAKEKEPESKKLLLKFQVLLEEITDWNKDKVLRETGGISASTQCDYLEELLAAVFIAHTKVLSAIRLTTKQKKLQITIPKLDHFLHRTLTECARILWSNTYLFSPGAPSLERQRNLRQIETLLYDGVLQSIRGMLPVKNILREYLHEEEGGSDDEEEEAEGEEAAPAAAEESTEAGAPAALEDLSGAGLGVEGAPSPAEDLSGAAGAPSQAPTLVVDTTQPVVPPFSGSDTNALPPAVESEPVLEEDAAAAATEEEILLMEGPALPFDDFEDLENKAAAPATAQPESDELEMDFETLE
jgi:hypothetical protein